MSGCGHSGDSQHLLGARPVGADHHLVAEFHGLQHALEHRFGHVQAAPCDAFADALVVIAAMDGKALPAELAGILIEREGLLDAVHGFEAHVADSIFAGFAIATEVDRIHVLEQGLSQFLFCFA